MACPKIALRFLCLFVRTYHVRNILTMQLQCTAAFEGLQAKLQQMKVIVCCLDGENLVGSRKDRFCGI